MSYTLTCLSPLNCILFFLQTEVIILDLGPENSFVKKGRKGLSLTETLAVNKKKKSMAGLALGTINFDQDDTE